MKKIVYLLLVFSAITVNAQVANQPSNLDACDDNTDGVFCFDLSFQIPQILGSQNPTDYNVSFHGTQFDANAGVNALPFIYCATIFETIYVRVEDASNTALFDTTSFDLIVNIPPILQQLTPLEECDDDFDELAIFDLTSREATMIGSQTGITFQYYASNLDLINDIPIANPTAYQNSTNPQTIYVRATNLASCSSVVTFDIRVLPIPFPNPNPTPIEACDDDTDGILIFDITVRENEIINVPDVIVSYHTTLIDAELGQNVIVNPFAYAVDMATANANGEVIIYVRAESIINYNSANEPCYAVVELPIIVNRLPVLSDSSYNYTFCELDGDGVGQFNWDEVTSVLNILPAPQNSSDFTVTYHSTVGGAVNNTGVLSNGYENTADPQTVYMRVENTTTGCVNLNNIASVQLNVELAPSATSPPVYELCADDASNPNTAIFGLSTLNSSIIAGQSNVTVFYYQNATDAMNTSNALPAIYVSSSQTIYARTQNTITGCYSDPVAVILQVNPAPVVTLPDDRIVCVDNSGQLFAPFSIGTDLGPGFIYQWTTPFGMSNGSTVTVTQAGTYSLLVTDINSSASCSYVDSVTFTGESAPCSLSVTETTVNPVTIYPNPVKNELILTSETNLQISTLAIYSLEGKLIRQQNVGFNDNEIRVNVADFNASFYILKLQTVTNEFLTKRFIVE